MKLINLIALTIILLSSIACSSTKTVKLDKIEKKPLISDHYLMMSLLNRPMTQDHKMMLAFAKRQEQYQQTVTPIFVNAVMITGDRSSTTSTKKTGNAYTSLIANDINAIRISGPY